MEFKLSTPSLDGTQERKQTCLAMLVHIHVRNYLYKSTTLVGEKYYNIYYPGEGKMFTTLALFVLKLEMMLLLEIVLTLPRLLLF